MIDDKDFYDVKEFERQQRFERQDPMRPYYDKFGTAKGNIVPIKPDKKFYEPGNAHYDWQHSQPNPPVDHELFMFSRQFEKEFEKKSGKLYNLVMTNKAFQELKAQTKAKLIRGGGKNLMEDYTKQMLALAKYLGWSLICEEINTQES